MAKLTLSMIVKNEEKYLRDCLVSVKKVVDEIVIVDTGSTDETIKIAEEFGAKIFKFDWIDDFSAARNYALEKSLGDWILYLDADERLDSDSVDEVKKLIKSNSPVAYYTTVKSYDSDGSRDNSLRYTRLFKNSKELKFVGTVHEQIEPSLIKNNYRLTTSNIVIHHLGYSISKEEQKKKALRNLTLLKKDYELKSSSYGAFQLGQSFNILEDNENARKYFGIAANSTDLHFSLRAQSLSALALISHNENNTIDANNFIKTSIKLDNSQPFAHLLASKIAVRKGDISFAMEECKKACNSNKNISSLSNQSNLSVFLDPEEVIYFGLTLALQNQNSAEINFYYKELSMIYNKREAKNGILKLAVIQKLFGYCGLSTEEEKIVVEMANKNTLTLILNLLLSNQNKQQALVIAENLLSKFPDSIEVPKIIAKLLDAFGKTEEAILCLEKAIENDKYDAAELFYLITFYLKLGKEKNIAPIVSKLEKEYSDIPEVIERVKKMKEKLKFLTNN